MSTVSERMGLKTPANHVTFPSESHRRVLGYECSIREIRCQCGALLFAIVLEGLAEADVIWPFDVICGGTEHRLVARGTKGTAKVVCHGKFADEHDAKRLLASFDGVAI